MTPATPVPVADRAPPPTVVPGPGYADGAGLYDVAVPRPRGVFDDALAVPVRTPPPP